MLIALCHFSYNNPVIQQRLLIPTYIQVGKWTVLERFCNFPIYVQEIYIYIKQILFVITKYHKLGGLNNKNLFLTVLETGSQNSRCWQVQFLQRPLYCACTRPPSHCVLVLSFLCVQTFLMSLCLLIGTPVILDWGPTLQPHLTLIIFLKVRSPNTVMLGVRASTYEFGRIQFSP